MTRNELIVLLFGLVFLFKANAQQSSLVHLKNGSSIRGRILQDDESGVRVRTRDGSTWNFPADEVASIEKYSPAVSTPGYYNRTSLGIMGGDQVSPSLQVVNGYSFNRHWEVGFGMGLESFYWDAYVPFFIEGRYSPVGSRTLPFVSMNAGYEMPMRNFEFNKGGFTAGLQVGISHYFSNHFGIMTSVGYRFAHLKELNAWWEDFETIRQINRFEIRFGLVFR